MFRLDNLLEQWAQIYRPLRHDPSAASTHRTYFRISMIDNQSYFVRNFTTQPSPCMAYATHPDADTGANNKQITYQHFVYFLVKQINSPGNNSVMDEMAATEARYECDDHCQNLLAFLDAMQTAANDGAHQVDIAGHIFQITKEDRQGLRGLQLEKVHWNTMPTRFNGWQLCGMSFDQLVPRTLCIKENVYIDSDSSSSD